jgi:hypothetical protein
MAAAHCHSRPWHSGLIRASFLQTRKQEGEARAAWSAACGGAVGTWVHKEHQQPGVCLGPTLTSYTHDCAGCDVSPPCCHCPLRGAAGDCQHIMVGCRAAQHTLAATAQHTQAMEQGLA